MAVHEMGPKGCEMEAGGRCVRTLPTSSSSSSRSLSDSSGPISPSPNMFPPVTQSTCVQPAGGAVIKLFRPEPVDPIRLSPPLLSLLHLCHECVQWFGYSTVVTGGYKVNTVEPKYGTKQEKNIVSPSRCCCRMNLRSFFFSFFMF